MKQLIKENIEFSLCALILLIATAYFIIRQNYEFLIYALTLTLLIIFLFMTDAKFKFIKPAKWGFLAWMVLHMAGGSVYIKGTRLYDFILIPLIGEPYNVLKYDQFVHFFCYVVMTLILFSFLITISKKDYNKKTFFVMLVLAASSIGAINEIIEFSAVVMFESNGVGGYYNTLLDLIGNLIGAVLGASYLHYRKLF